MQRADQIPNSTNRSFLNSLCPFIDAGTGTGTLTVKRFTLPWICSTLVLLASIGLNWFSICLLSVFSCSIYRCRFSCYAIEADWGWSWIDIYPLNATTSPGEPCSIIGVSFSCYAIECDWGWHWIDISTQSCYIPRGALFYYICRFSRYAIEAD